MKWAFGFPGELSADAQPAIAGGRVFVGTQSGTVYALSAATGCVHWTFQADAAVRAAVTIAPIQPGDGSRVAAFVGDRSGFVYALDAATGTQIWKVRVDDHPFARVTASPTVHDGRVYVGVASGEETAGAVGDYQCCTFRGSLVALDAATGAQVWKTFTIEPRQANVQEQDGHAAIRAFRRANLVEPGDRHAAQCGLRDDREQLQRPRHRQERCVRRLRSRLGQDLVVAPDDRRRRLEHLLSPPRPDQLHQHRGPRSRLRVAAHAGELAQRPARAGGGAEVGDGARARSRSRGADPVAAAGR